MPFHTVVSGDTLLALASKAGLDSWEDIVNAPENASIKDTLTDPGILKRGISVFIPNKELKQQPSAIDAKHPFNVKRPKAWLRMAIKNADGTALANGKYDFTAADKTINGTIAATGIIEEAVPITTTSGTLKVVSGKVTAQWQLRIGWMDPISEDSGIKSRLANLHFDFGDNLAGAVMAFQVRTGLTPTGTVDDALREKLKSYYDPAQDETTLNVEPEAATEDETQNTTVIDDAVTLNLIADVQLCKAAGEAAGDKLRLPSIIKIQLIGEDNEAIPNEKYAVKVLGGTAFEGTLDAQGMATITNIPFGVCSVSFPDLDKDAWTPAAQTQTQTQTAPPAESAA